ncbi:hypothetical protein EVAR_85316_1 [Eumeta japonica]|uniref:Uncharacterized protein n=1 Tax=Eumeta variegata TaxID=151549 RepID=A0A4C1V7Z0_EUMVA|nr:hypothetical protein EVAR_85316_1 [Eumeta japonica]
MIEDAWAIGTLAHWTESNSGSCYFTSVFCESVVPHRPSYCVALKGCGWESLMKNVTLGNVTMSHRTREARQCLASLSHSTMIGLPRALE